MENAAAIENLTLQMKFDDGFVAYINGVEVTRSNTRDDVNGFDSRGRSHADRLAVEFVNFDISSSLSEIDLGAENVLAVHIMNTSISSNDLLVSLQLVDGLLPDTRAVGIPHEQTSDPTIVFESFDQNPESGNQDEEFVELKNTSAEALDISGWTLQGGLVHTFRGGTVIPAGESLYVTPNSLAFRNRATGPRGGMGLFVQDGIDGHLSNRGETVELVNRDGIVIASLTTTDVASDVQNNLRVTELHYNPTATDESLEFIEVINISTTTTLDLNGVRITDGPSEPFDFSTSDVKTLAPGAFALVVSDMNAFTTAYPNVDPSLIAGTYEGSLSNGGETIKIEDSQNGTVQEFRYEDGTGDGEEAWHASTDGGGFSLVIRDVMGSIDAWNDGAGWRPSSQMGGSPGEADTDLDVDFDDDGDVDADDIDLLSAGVRNADLAFDLNQDGVADGNDRELMINVSLHTTVGDSNLDGVFNSQDLVLVFTAGQYEDNVPGNSGWASGDWDGDGDFAKQRFGRGLPSWRLCFSGSICFFTTSRLADT